MRNLGIKTRRGGVVAVLVGGALLIATPAHAEDNYVIPDCYIENALFVGGAFKTRDCEPVPDSDLWCTDVAGKIFCDAAVTVYGTAIGQVCAVVPDEVFC